MGAYLIDGALMADKLSIFGDMIVFSSYAMQVIMAFLMLSMIFMIWPRAEVSAGRINEVLDTPIQISEGQREYDTEEKGTLEFKDVSFRYPGAEAAVLSHISFKVKQGQTVAFIGSTGSGKSTLINLIPRFYDVTDGQILLDGHDIKEYRQEALQNKIGYVSQKAVLFEGDIASNVAFGQKQDGNYTEEQIEKAIRVAQSESFVADKDGGIHAKVAQRGSNFSGGQKQRLSIARAVAKDPEMLIFDDSFSALDYQTDANLRKALAQECKDTTVLIVAQRIGTILHADQIVVLDQGKCVGIGTHKELMENCDVYKEIALSQLSKEELDNA
ncbi:ABC transporter family protein [Chlamydia trachomatis]|nr:ABC transporter family protein [Chlamydia trachomatis]